MSVAVYIVPVFVVAILLFGLVRKVNVFDSFVSGAASGLNTAKSLLPVLVGLTFAVTVFTQSGAADVISHLLGPVFRAVGVPEELISLCIISPVSGSGSLAVFEDILSSYGPDSYVGRVASVISGSTETTFYALAVYLGTAGIKKYGALVPCALLGDIVSFITASLAVRVFMV